MYGLALPIVLLPPVAWVKLSLPSVRAVSDLAYVNFSWARVHANCASTWVFVERSDQSDAPTLHGQAASAFPSYSHDQALAKSTSMSTSSQQQVSSQQPALSSQDDVVMTPTPLPESSRDKFFRKMKEQPLVPIGKQKTQSPRLRNPFAAFT